MKVVAEFIKRNIAGETILVPTGDTAQKFNGMITLTDTAEFIWDNLEKVDSLDAMVRLILETYEVDEETAKKDAAGFITALLKNGFAEYSKEDKTW